MFTISKRFAFSASHTLDSLPEGHKCRRLHGHNYLVEVVLQAAALDEHGMVRDYGDLASFREWLMATLDHRHLNDVIDQPTTAEVLAVYLHGQARAMLPVVVAVRVSETPDTWAEYRP